jgi:activating signal cointegrator 1
MKALTLYQPWATLVAIGAKKIETRSWSTKYRGPVAIHASKKFPIEFHGDSKPFRSCLKGILFSDNPSTPWQLIKSNLHLGCIIAVCELVVVVPIDNQIQGYRVIDDGYDLNIPIPPLEPDRSFGDYTPGRYAWILENVRMLKEPIPCKGMLGLWTVPMSAEVDITWQTADHIGVDQGIN